MKSFTYQVVLRNKFWKDLSKENELSFTIQRNKCVSLWRMCLKITFKVLPKNSLVTDKSFWKFL